MIDSKPNQTLELLDYISKDFFKMEPKKGKWDPKCVPQTAPAHFRKSKQKILHVHTASSAVTQTEEDFEAIAQDISAKLQTLGFITRRLSVRIEQKKFTEVCCFFLEKIKGRRIKKSKHHINYIQESASNLGIPPVSVTHFQTPYAEAQWPHIWPFLQELSDRAFQTAFPPPPPPTEPVAAPQVRTPILEPCEPLGEYEGDHERPSSPTRRRPITRRWTVAQNSSDDDPAACPNADTIFRDPSGAPIPLTKQGLPNLNYNVSKNWVKAQCESCEGVVPNWVTQKDLKLNNISKLFYKHFDSMYPSPTSE